MLREVVIMQGVPGSGKTTYIKRTTDALATREPSAYHAVVSADAFFTAPSGKFTFDPRRLSDAHGDCLRKFVDLVREGAVNYIYVDNCNVHVAEIAPYYALAEAYNYQPRIVRVLALPDVAFRRCTHSLSQEYITSKHGLLMREASRFPPHWRVTFVVKSDT